MSEKVRFEPCPKIRYANCPHCGKEAKVVGRSTDFRFYVIECKECGRVELTENETKKARTAWKEDRKTELALKLTTLPQIRKKKTDPRKKRNKRNLKSAQQQRIN